MRKAFLVLLLTAAGLAAQAPASAGTTAPKTAKKPAVAKPVVAKKVTSAPQHPLIIPKDAVANSDGSYSWKDKQGKSWLFVKTPFGVMKSEGNDTPATSTAMAGVKAFDDGDKVRFERPSPFGAMKWEKNKSELTDEERAVVSSQATSPATSQNAK
jgi:hypothetical protein